MRENQQKGLNLLYKSKKKKFFCVHYRLYCLKILYCLRALEIILKLGFTFVYLDVFSMINNAFKAFYFLFLLSFYSFIARQILLFLIYFKYFLILHVITYFFFTFSFLIIPQRLCFKLRGFSKGSRKRGVLISLWYKT